MDFYHATARPLVEVAVRLVERATAAGQRLLATGPAPLVETLDMALWTHDPASFLAHGPAGGLHAAFQPVLLATAPGQPENGARLWLALEPPLPPAPSWAVRLLVAFGPEGLEPARAAWRAWAARDDAVPAYWQEANGRWTKRA